MGRPKGSKNKTKEGTTPVSKVTPAPKQSEGTPISKSEAKKLLQDTIQKLKDIGAEYGAEDIPEKYKNLAHEILNAPSLEAAEDLTERIPYYYQVYILNQWGRGVLPGPQQEHVVMARHKKATDLANWLEKQGKSDNAAQQRDRAQAILDTWEEYRSKSVKVSDTSIDENCEIYQDGRWIPYLT